MAIAAGKWAQHITGKPAASGVPLTLACVATSFKRIALP
jgi:hypothetical protein